MFNAKLSKAMQKKLNEEPSFKKFFEENEKMLMNKGGQPFFSSLDHDEKNETEVHEPHVLFLGTVSMKPGSHRGASAIYLFHRGHGILMDCAEGSYG